MGKDIIIPATERGMLMWQCMSLGIRDELLDLIDYAGRHNGIVPLAHLYEELKGLPELDSEALERRIQNYVSKNKAAIEYERTDDNV